MQPQVVGIAWYKEENYARLREIFADGDKLPPSFAGWHNAALATKEKLENDGLTVYCVDIEPNRFSDWCRSQKMMLNSEARNKYSSYIAFKLATEKQ